MKLSEWVKRQERGVSGLMFKSGLAYTTVLRAVRGQSVSKATAQKLSEATGGEVSAASISHPEEDDDERGAA